MDLKLQDDIAFHIADLSEFVVRFKNKNLEPTEEIRTALDSLNKMVKCTLKLVQKTNLEKDLERRVVWLLGEITELRARNIEPPPLPNFYHNE